MTPMQAAFSVPQDPAPDEAEPADLSPPDSGVVVEHPDGFYWLAPDGSQQFGPFATAAEALADANAAAAGESGWEPGETIQEAEQELGVSDWVDPDTGEPAEETHTRFEDH